MRIKLPYKRLTIDLALKEPLTIDQQLAFDNCLTAIKKIKEYAVCINDSKVNEENTINAAWHICHNDTNEPCEDVHEL